MSKDEEAQSLVALSDKEDELDELFERLSDIFRDPLDWVEDNVSEALRQMNDADMVEDYRDGISTLEDVSAEIRSIVKLRNEHWDTFEKAEELSDEVHKLRNKV